MILPAFRRSHHDRNIHALYGAIVAQARSAAFYTVYGVPDTVEGRFELIVLHLVLVLARLGRPDEGAPGGGRGPTRAFGQQLFDVFCRDLDDNLREMGVGDLTVPKRMQAFGEAFYGRTAAYDLALADSREALAQALCKNILNGEGIECARGLAYYAAAAIAALSGLDDAAMRRASWRFPHPARVGIQQ